MKVRKRHGYWYVYHVYGTYEVALEKYSTLREAFAVARMIVKHYSHDH